LQGKRILKLLKLDKIPSSRTEGGEKKKRGKGREKMKQLSVLPPGNSGRAPNLHETDKTTEYQSGLPPIKVAPLNRCQVFLLKKEAAL